MKEEEKGAAWVSSSIFSFAQLSPEWPPAQPDRKRVPAPFPQPPSCLLLTATGKESQEVVEQGNN